MSIPYRVTLVTHYQRVTEGVKDGRYVAGIRIYAANRVSDLTPERELAFASLYLPGVYTNLGATKAVMKYASMLLMSVFTNAYMPAVYVLRDRGIIDNPRLRARAIEVLESAGVPTVHFKSSTKPVSLCLPLCDAAAEQKRSVFETFQTYEITGGNNHAAQE